MILVVWSDQNNQLAEGGFQQIQARKRAHGAFFGPVFCALSSPAIGIGE